MPMFPFLALDSKCWLQQKTTLEFSLEKKLLTYVNVSAERYKKVFGRFLLFPAQANIRTTALWTTGFWEHWRITTLWFFLEASSALHHTYHHHHRHFDIASKFFGTISIISVVSLHFLFDIKDIICVCGELVILILLLTCFYAKKTLNSELLNCELQNVFYLNLAKAVFLSLTKN